MLFEGVQCDLTRAGFVTKHAPAPKEADAGRAAHLMRRCHHPVGAQLLYVHRHVRHALAGIHKQLAAHLRGATVNSDNQHTDATHTSQACMC